MIFDYGYHVILFEIFTFLDYPDLMSLQSVNRFFRGYCQDSMIRSLISRKHEIYMDSVLNYRYGSIYTLEQKLNLAISEEDLLSVRYLISRITVPDHSLYYAASLNRYRSLSLIFSLVDIPIDTKNECLYLAAKDNCYEAAKLVLEDPRVDPGSYYSSSFTWSAGNGHLDIVKLLINDPRVDPTAGDMAAYHWALENGHGEVVEFLSRDPRVSQVLNGISH